MEVTVRNKAAKAGRFTRIVLSLVDHNGDGILNMGSTDEETNEGNHYGQRYEREETKAAVGNLIRILYLLLYHSPTGVSLDLLV